MSDDWTDRIVGARMTVDNEFTQRIASSEFTSQEWGMIMTAVEFEIEHPADDERAKLVANTSKVPQILPELENVRQGMSAMGGAPQSGGSSGSSGGGGGIFSGIKKALGIGGGSGGGSADDAKLAAADQLAQEYAQALQSNLESRGQWDQVRAIAAKED